MQRAVASLTPLGVRPSPLPALSLQSMYCKVKTEGRTVFVHTNPLETIGAIKVCFANVVGSWLLLVPLFSGAREGSVARNFFSPYPLPPEATYCGLVDEAVASVKLHDAAGTLLKDEDTVQALGYDTGFVLRASD